MTWIIPVALGMAATAIALGALGTPTAASEAWIYAVMLGMAAATSAGASLVGLGGGLVLVPILLMMGMPPAAAASASLAATISNAAGSTVAYARQGRINYRVGAKMGLMAAPGSVLGAVLSSGAEPGLFGLLLAAALVAAAVYILLRSKMGTHEPSQTRVVVALSAAASFFAGVVSSYFGIGGGIVFVPLLVMTLGMTIARAAPTSMFALLLTSIPGVVMHALLGHSDAVAALLLSAGGLLGGLAGARLSLVVGERHLRVIAATVMFGVAFKMAWDAVAADIP